MPRTKRFLALGVFAAWMSTSWCFAQGLPAPLPPIAPAPPADVIPNPPLVLVPPNGPQPSWAPPLLDPVATAKGQPKFVVHKSRSWPWRRLQGKAYGYPEEFRPRPLGAALYDHGNLMAANGAAARLTLYQYDFVDGTNQLSPRGRDQLTKIAAQLAVSPYPLIIERSAESPALAESRRYAVLAELTKGPSPVTSDRVLVGQPIAHGLSGMDAQIISSNALTRTLLYGPPIPILSNGVNSPSGVTTNTPSTFPGQ